MEVVKISLTRLKIAEFIQLASDCETTIKNYDPVVLDIEESFQIYAGHVTEMSLLYDPNDTSPFRDELIRLDGLRDDAIIGLTKILDGITYHKDNEIEKNAQQLLNQIKSYGSSIARMNYPKETAVLSGIVKDFTTQPAFKSSVTSLSLDYWVKEIEESNNAFNATYLARAGSDAKESDITLSQKRLETIEAFYEMTDLLESFYKIKKAKKAGFELYEGLIKNLNVILDKYSLLISSKKSSSKTTNTTATSGTSTSATTN